MDDCFHKEILILVVEMKMVGKTNPDIAADILYSMNNKRLFFGVNVCTLMRIKSFSRTKSEQIGCSLIVTRVSYQTSFREITCCNGSFNSALKIDLT